jgi:hypothetical protein
MSTKKNYTTKVAMVNRFLCQVRRPLCRWLIYVGSKEEVSANHAAVKGLAYVDPKVVLGGPSRLWGRLPTIDGVEVIPPVQLGIPAEYAERMRKVFSARLPVIYYSEESYIALNRHHIVFGDDKIKSSVVSSYAMRENLMCGGHPTAAAFSGLFHMKDGQGGYRHAVLANGMILGQCLYGVGHFGSLCSNLEADWLVGSEEYTSFPVDKNEKIPFVLRPVWNDAREKEKGRKSNIVGSDDLLSRKRNDIEYRFYEATGGVRILPRDEFYEPKGKNNPETAPVTNKEHYQLYRDNAAWARKLYVELTPTLKYTTYTASWMCSKEKWYRGY